MTNDEVRMSFTEHLAELRMRLIRAGLGLLVGFIVCAFFSEQLFHFIVHPLRSALPEGEAPIFTVLSPTESFVVRLRLALYGGLLLAMPWVLYQVLAFIFPGLRPKERRAAWFLLGGCSVLTLAGLALGYRGVLPLVLPYLLEFTPKDVAIQLRISETVSFVLKALVGFAAAFQLPMVVLILAYLGLVTPAMLVRWRRVAYIGLAVLAAVFTPPDPMTMVILMVPLVILYEASIIAARVMVRRRAARPDGGTA